jgi:zinc protease
MSFSSFAPTRWVLANGLTVLTQQKPSTQAVSIGLSFAAGGAFDADDRAGLATLVARGLTRGTRDRSKTQIGEVLDDRGAHLGGTAGRHTAGLGARCRRADFDAILDLLAECATLPTFPDAEVERIRGDRLTALREDDDDPATVVGNVLRELIYPGGHPYGRRLRGTVETVSAIGADDLRRFHSDHYDLSAASLVIVGDLPPDGVLASVCRAFATSDGTGAGSSGYRSALPVIADVPRPDEARRRVVELPDKSQVDIALGGPGLRRDDPRYYAAAVMNMILGRFAMGGRLGRSVREEQGMAYYTYSVIDGSVGAGPFVVRAGVQARHVEPAVKSILQEIERIRQEPPGAEELDDARAAMIRSLPRMLESNEGIASVLHQIELFDLGLDYLARYPDLIDSVDAEAVRSVAEQLLDSDHYCLAIAGPYPAG